MGILDGKSFTIVPCQHNTSQHLVSSRKKTFAFQTLVDEMLDCVVPRVQLQEPP